MMLESERLQLQPLNARQLQLWVEDRKALEKELNCRYEAEYLEGVFLEIVKGQIEKTKRDEENYKYHSFWFLLRKTDRVVVGSAGFKGLPDENQMLEIGYGLGKEHQHKGYMTEAVEAMCRWALASPKVKNIIAETEADNVASQNVLKRCGFLLYKTEDTLWWKL